LRGSRHGNIRHALSSHPIRRPREFAVVLQTRRFVALTASVNDYDIISARLTSPDWVQHVFQIISLPDLGRIIAHVHVGYFDQPRVAALLAKHIRNFTCHYAAHAVKNSSDWNRSTMAETLIPLCLDISQNHALIRAELNEWELTVTDRDFENAIAINHR
jgi:hypothetical protein